MKRASAAAMVGLSLFACACSQHLGPLDPGSGNEVDVNFGDVEPNNTPDEATPLGVAGGPDVTVWVGTNEVGGAANPADYFVFESSSQPGLFQFDMCYTPAITGMTATLAKVVDAEVQSPPIATWTITTICATSFTAPLEASTVYLFGVLATGGAGTYTA